MEEGIHVALSAEKIGEIWGIPITNTLVTGIVVALLLVTLGFLAGSRLKMIPGRFQTLLELVLGGVYDYVSEVLESKKLARAFFPLLVTVFLFVFVANWMEFIPGIGSIGFFHEDEFVSLFRSVNTDLNMPLALAIISFLVVEITGVATLGFVKYAGKFITFKSPIAFAVGLVELVGEVVRVVSLSFRLFGNILAGEIIILVAMYFMPYLLPVPLMLFELFIGFLQAAIFALLTLFFLKLAVAEPHEAH